MADRISQATPTNHPTRRTVLAAVGAGLGLSVPAWAQGSKDSVTLQCAGAYTDVLFHTQNLKQFASQAVSQSNGSLKIDVVTNAKLMPMTQVIPALSKGDLAMGEIFMSNFSAQYPLLAIDSLPFIVRSSDDAKRLWEATRKPIEEMFAKQGIRVLYTAPWPGQGLFSRNQVNKLDDLKGLKFRANNQASKYIAEIAGAKPADTAANNLAKSIKDGEVDVMVTSSTTGVDSESWLAMGHFVDMRAWIPKNLILISEKHWGKLPEAAKTALLDAAKNAEARAWQLAKDADDNAQKILVQNGTKISTPSYELRRQLDLMGEKFAREWSGKAGVEGAGALINYYFPK